MLHLVKACCLLPIIRVLAVRSSVAERVQGGQTNRPTRTFHCGDYNNGGNWQGDYHCWDHVPSGDVDAYVDAQMSVYAGDAQKYTGTLKLGYQASVYFYLGAEPSALNALGSKIEMDHSFILFQAPLDVAFPPIEVKGETSNLDTRNVKYEDYENPQHDFKLVYKFKEIDGEGKFLKLSACPNCLYVFTKQSTLSGLAVDFMNLYGDTQGEMTLRINTQHPFGKENKLEVDMHGRDLQLHITTIWATSLKLTLKNVEENGSQGKVHVHLEAGRKQEITLDDPSQASIFTTNGRKFQTREGVLRFSRPMWR